MNSDTYWDWHTGDDSTKIPKHIGSPAQQRSGRMPELASDVHQSGKGYGPTVDVVTTSPTRVRVGFFPTTSIDTTNPAELPGSRDDKRVITTPPHPSSTSSASKSTTSTTPKASLTGAARPRAESIEDADKRRENYIPQSVADKTDDEELEPNTFCLPFSTLIGSQLEEKQRQSKHYSGRGGDFAEVMKRPSVTPSEISIISVSVLLASR